MKEKMTKLRQLNHIKGDARKLQYLDKKFDLLSSSHSLIFGLIYFLSLDTYCSMFFFFIKHVNQKRICIRRLTNDENGTK